MSKQNNIISQMNSVEKKSKGRPRKIINDEIKINTEGEKEDFRTCIGCNESKKLNGDFYHKNKEGWFSKCKECRNARRRENYKNNENYRKNKADYQRKYQVTYYAENKEKFREYRLKYAEKINQRNKEKRKIQREHNKLKKEEDFQKLVKEEALKLIKNGEIELSN